jgi:HK97 family phage major capsid protein
MTITATRPDEFEAMLTDETVTAGFFDQGKPTDKFTEFITGYIGSVRNKDTTIEQQVTEQVQRGLANFLKEHGQDQAGRPPVPLGAGTVPANRAERRNKLYNRKAPGAKLDNTFEDAAEFLQTVWCNRGDYLSPARNQELNAKQTAAREIQNSFGSVVPADGGYLIPETLRSELLSVALEQAIVRPRATVIPMESLRVPIPTIDSTSNVSSVFGGIVCYWTEESGPLTESQASFGRVVLDAHKLIGYCVVPNELVADAPAFAGFFNARFPQAVVFFEDVAFMTGSGVGEPLGFINCPAAVIASAVSGQGANTIVVENLAAMYARMLPTSLMNAAWIADIGTFPQLATMALSVGTGGGPVWMSGGGYNDGIVGAPPVTIYGRPVIFTEKCSVLGTTGDISLVDLSYYLVGDRQIMQAASSEHYKFANDQLAFRIIERVDGRPWIQSAITPKNNGNTLSPFVQLSSTRT